MAAALARSRGLPSPLPRQPRPDLFGRRGSTLRANPADVARQAIGARFAKGPVLKQQGDKTTANDDVGEQADGHVKDNGDQTDYQIFREDWTLSYLQPEPYKSGHSKPHGETVQQGTAKPLLPE